MQYSDDFKDALQYLNKNYPDTRLNNNKSVIANDSFEIEDSFRFLSMKQSHYKNVVYRKSLFENVALTGSTFENVKFLDSKLIGNSFANCNFYDTEINGSRAALSANNFSQSNFENCIFKKVKFFRSGILNALYHRCDFNKILFRGSTLEGTKFISCKFSDCDFGNVNIDYTMFSKNDYDNVIFPFYQIAYIIGAADFIRDPSQIIYAKAGEKSVPVQEYFEQADRLKQYYLDKSEYFPTCNLCIAQQRFEEAKEYLLTGTEKALINKNFRMISNFCRLAKYHGIADENLKSKILKSMEDFIKGDNIPDSQLNYYLIYIGNIKTLLNEGGSDTVTLHYTIKTDICKKDKEGIRMVNNMVNKLTDELSKLENIEGYDITVSNHSPHEIAIDIICLALMLPSAIEAVMQLIAKTKEYINQNKSNSSKGAFVEIDTDSHKKYIDARIENMKSDLLLFTEKYKKAELKTYIVEVTQSLKTDLEDLYSKDIMICKFKRKKS